MKFFFCKNIKTLKIIKINIEQINTCIYKNNFNTVEQYKWNF